MRSKDAVCAMGIWYKWETDKLFLLSLKIFCLKRSLSKYRFYFYFWNCFQYVKYFSFNIFSACSTQNELRNMHSVQSLFIHALKARSPSFWGVRGFFTCFCYFIYMFFFHFIFVCKQFSLDLVIWICFINMVSMGAILAIDDVKYHLLTITHK